MSTGAVGPENKCNIIRVTYADAEKILSQQRALCVKYEGEPLPEDKRAAGFFHDPESKILCKPKPNQGEGAFLMGYFCEPPVDEWTEEWIDKQDETRKRVKEILKQDQQGRIRPLVLSTLYPKP